MCFFAFVIIPSVVEAYNAIADFATTVGVTKEKNVFI